MNVQAGHRARLMVRPAAGWEETLMSEESAFRRLAADDPERCVEVDGEGAPGEVAARVREAVFPRLDRMK